jgi:rhodanese-related sulfurtransferase
MTHPSISAEEFKVLCDTFERIDLLDVRTPAEFDEVHLSAARNIPIAELNPANTMRLRQHRSTEPLYVICQSGGRGRQACKLFQKAGFSNVVNVEGGTAACIKAGLPVVRGRKTISLERQVRIAAGSLVLLGLVLASLVHPAFALLSAFVGAGLVFAGVTDTCGMGLVLARMPWNVRSTPAVAACASGSTRNVNQTEVPR